MPSSTGDLDRFSYGRAFKYYLLLSQWPSVLGDDPAPSHEALFYTTLFWFLKFIRLSSLTVASDASPKLQALRQQGLELIENAGFDVDQSLLKEIERRVESDQ